MERERFLDDPDRRIAGQDDGWGPAQRSHHDLDRVLLERPAGTSSPHVLPSGTGAFYLHHSGPLGDEETRPDRLDELWELERSYAAPSEDPPSAVPSRRRALQERHGRHASRPDWDEVPTLRSKAPEPLATPWSEREWPDEEPAPRRRRAAQRSRPRRPARRLGSEAAAEDQRLLEGLGAFAALLRHLAARYSLYPRLPLVALGFAAIGPLAVSYAGLLPLSVGAALILFPATLTALALGVRHPGWGRRALVGYGAGIVATAIYDVLRLGLVAAGLWGDPIPGIGRLLLGDPSASFVWGYLWRFLGNGAGMGLAYALLPWRGVRSGVLYGTLIALGLLALLAVSPRAASHFFPLTPATAAGAMLGHWVYGAVLGGLTARTLRERPERGSS